MKGNKSMNDNPETMSMENHAITWWTEKGYDIPPIDSAEWEITYSKWVNFAFERL